LGLANTGSAFWAG